MTKYYIANASNKPIGPHSLEEVHNFFRRGEIGLDTFVISEGANAWIRYRALHVSTGESAVPPPAVPPPNVPASAIPTVQPLPPVSGSPIRPSAPPMAERFQIDGQADINKTHNPLMQIPEKNDVRSCVGGLLIGVGIAILCHFAAPKGSFLSRMFNLGEIQVIIPIAILGIFFWGLFMCSRRWNNIRKFKQDSFEGIMRETTSLLKRSGVDALVTRLEKPDAEHHPLLCRIKALIMQWRLKPGLLEADLILEQFVRDDEESTRRAYSLMRTFVWALPVLGLIGTVLGIAFAVGGFANFLGGRVDDVDVIKQSLVGVTGGLSFAFLLTLQGLTTSLILMLLSSSLETKEEKFCHSIQQQIVADFLPVLQQVAPAENSAGQAQTVEFVIDPMQSTTDAVVAHVKTVAEKLLGELFTVMEAQQQQASTWGKTLQEQAAATASTVKASWEDGARSMRETSGEILGRLDQVRQSWNEQANQLQATLENQITANKNLAAELNAASQKQMQANAALLTTFQSMQGALSASTTCIQSLESAFGQLSNTSLEQAATSMAKSLDRVVAESDKISQSVANLGESTRKTAETQASIQVAVKQLDDIGLVETLDAFRKALTRHADLVDKLNSGLKLTLNV